VAGERSGREGGREATGVRSGRMGLRCGEPVRGRGLAGNLPSLWDLVSSRRFCAIFSFLFCVVDHLATHVSMLTWHTWKPSSTWRATTANKGHLSPLYELPYFYHMYLYNKLRRSTKAMYNGVTLVFPYGCHVRFLLSWRRENAKKKVVFP
jgi:hypothetical protein